MYAAKTTSQLQFNMAKTVKAEHKTKFNKGNINSKKEIQRREM